ncbi:MAG: hypothetical protein AAFU70_05080, partial [Planctomycetota bacterium]
MPRAGSASTVADSKADTKNSKPQANSNANGNANGKADAKANAKPDAAVEAKPGSKPALNSNPKPAQPEPISKEKAQALDRALQQIDRSFGKGAIMRLDEDAYLAIPGTSTGALSLDDAPARDAAPAEGEVE